MLETFTSPREGVPGVETTGPGIQCLLTSIPLSSQVSVWFSSFAAKDFVCEKTAKWGLLQQSLVLHPLPQNLGKQKQLSLISQAQSVPIASPSSHRCQSSCGRSRKWALHYVQLLGKSWSRKTTFGIFFLSSAVSQMEQQVPKTVMNNH